MKKLLLFVFAVACTASNEEKLLDQSREIHDLVVEMGVRMKGKIDRIETSIPQVNEPVKSQLQDSLMALRQAFDYWQSTVIEVPGHSHDDHHHNHAPAPDITPEMMLDIQRDLKDQVEHLNIRAQKILDILEKDKYEPVK